MIAHKLSLDMPPGSEAGSERAQPPWGVAIPLLILWWMPWLGPLWSLAFPSWEIISAPGVGITNSSRTQIAILALLALAWSGQRPRWTGWRSAGVWLCAFLLWSAVSSLVGPDPVESLFFMLGWVAAACVLFAAPVVLSGNSSRGRQATLAWKVAVIHAPLIVASLVSLEPMLYASEDFRAAGPFQLPGALATWLVLLLPLALAELFRAQGKVVPLAMASSVLAVATLAMTLSRAAWLVAMFELVVMVLLEARRPARSLLGWAAFATVGVACLVMIRHSFTGLGLLLAVATLSAIPMVTVVLKRQLPTATALRILLLALLAGGLLAGARPDQSLSVAAQKRLSALTGTDDSAMGRLQFWQAALVLSLDHPLLGVAPSRFSESYPQVQKHYFYFSDSAHGALLELLAEVGWVGGGLLLVALGLFLKRCRPNPWSHPGQGPPLLGLLAGGLYSQVEVGYHFAIIWTTAAFLLAFLDQESPRAAPGRFPPLWIAPPLACLLPLFFLQKASEGSVRQVDPDVTYQQARQVSDTLPIWPHPTLTALAYGLRVKRPLAELEPLASRALNSARGDAATYQLAAEVDLLKKDYPQAQAHFSRSLELDPFNHPGSYHGLLMVAAASGDKDLAESVIERVLAIYDLEKGWEIAHQGHRANLALELRPLLYDIADGLNPAQQPTRTEPIYRFLARTGGEARALYGLGTALLSQGKTEEGRALIQQAHALDPAYPAP